MDEIEWNLVSLPGCVTSGIHEKECDECHIHGEYIHKAFRIDDMWGHNSKVTDQLDPTCAEDGFLKEECDRDGCDHELTTIVSKTGRHDMRTITVIHPSCRVQGWQSPVCDECGFEHVGSIIPRLAHKWVDGKETIAPTCTHEGAFARYCEHPGCDIAGPDGVVPRLASCGNIECLNCFPHVCVNAIYDGKCWDCHLRDCIDLECEACDPDKEVEKEDNNYALWWGIGGAAGITVVGVGTIALILTLRRKKIA